MKTGHEYLCANYHQALNRIMVSISLCYGISNDYVFYIYATHADKSIDKTISIIDAAFHLNKEKREGEDQHDFETECLSESGELDQEIYHNLSGRKKEMECVKNKIETPRQSSKFYTGSENLHGNNT